MPDTIVPSWEPPFAGTETAHLLGSLDRMRATFRWKADGLDADQLRVSLPSSTLTVGGLLKHLAAQEDYASAVKIVGAPMPPIWDENGWDHDNDWEFTSSLHDTPEALYGTYDAAVARSRDTVAATVEKHGLDGASGVALEDGSHASIRRILFDLLEEYARHTGHLDVLREAVDGRVGEDPPRDWTGWPPAGSPRQP